MAVADEYSIGIFVTVFSGVFLLIMSVISVGVYSLEDPDATGWESFLGGMKRFISEPVMLVLFSVCLIAPITVFLYLYSINVVRGR